MNITTKDFLQMLYGLGQEQGILPLPHGKPCRL